MFSRLSGLTFVLVASLGFVVPAHAGLVDGSFESPSVGAGFTPYSAGQSFGGWTVGSGGLVDLMGTGYASGLWSGPSEGSQYVYLGDSVLAANLYQDLTLDASTNYHLTFDLSPFATDYNGNGAKIAVDILSGGSTIIGGPAIYTRDKVSGYASESLNFTTSAAGTYRLNLQSFDGYGTNIDNFVLASVSVVPEPSTASLVFTAALITLSYGRRRRPTAIA